MNIKILVVQDKIKSEFADYLGLRVISNFIGALLCISIGYFLRPGFLPLLGLITILKVLDSFFDLGYAYFLKREYMFGIFFSRMIRCIALIGIIACSLLWFHVGVLKILAISIVISTISIIFDLKRLIKLFNFKKIIQFRTDTIKQICWVAFPLSFIGILDSFSGSIPKYVLNYFSYHTEIGIIAALKLFFLPINMVAGAFIQSIFPKLTKEVSNNNLGFVNQFVSKGLLIAGIGGVLCSITIFFLRESILELMYTTEIARYNLLFFIHSLFNIFVLFSYVYLFAIFGFGKLNEVMNLSVITFISLVVFNMVLIPKFGLAGAIYAGGITQLIRLLLLRNLFTKLLEK